MIQEDALERARALLIRRYSALTPLENADHALFTRLGPPEPVARGREIAIEGMPIRSPRFLVSGWACRFRLLGDGRRKIVSFLLPGDAIGICGRARPLALCSAAALTECLLLNGSPAFDDIWDDAQAHPNMVEALRLAGALDEKLLLDHIVRLGRQTALERMSHLLLELHWRLSQVGLANDWAFRLPLTQELLADGTGLSVVHVNRTLQQLRKAKLIDWRQQTCIILDPEGLRGLGEFAPPRLSEWV